LLFDVFLVLVSLVLGSLVLGSFSHHLTLPVHGYQLHRNGIVDHQ
jgi:hypothetical protein